MAKQYTVSDKEFWQILRENGGIFARTARAIAKQFNTTYTRQSVADRANAKPELLADIREENLDIAEEGLQSIMRKSSDNTRLDAIKFYLKTIGRKRGYVEKSEIDMNHKGENFLKMILNVQHKLTSSDGHKRIGDTGKDKKDT